MPHRCRQCTRTFATRTFATSAALRQHEAAVHAGWPALGLRDVAGGNLFTRARVTAALDIAVGELLGPGAGQLPNRVTTVEMPTIEEAFFEEED